MKKLDILKTVQLFIFTALAIVCFLLIVTDDDVAPSIAISHSVRLFSVLLWICLFFSFLFIFIDFSMYITQKRDYRALDYAAHSDPLAKIANRNGCDELIEQYIDQPLPPDMGCIMFELTSLEETNRNYNRMAGNRQIRNFSIILKMASVNTCFVGRNGGNRFLAIFEDSSREIMDEFLARIDQKVMDHNGDPQNPRMTYSYGMAFHEQHVKQITELVALSNRRLEMVKSLYRDDETTEASTLEET
ncbi:MAG: GGDEF domain-containing protein [Lachnospiraceae bacterium]|nr:GGDEF domain-containing protein [Lachnospiraceae bacterium]